MHSLAVWNLVNLTASKLKEVLPANVQKNGRHDLTRDPLEVHRAYLADFKDSEKGMK